ncbi:hypothetical protein BB560_003300 [Smittium megazygosporum]|uniref:Uncharacterized protein n=1 Tax=Smittium megazygosporum TaxID=133381 RepID=A0A2T9ZCF0_9FUNG|nr:hypothetical protein BB560_003300 [Smittium megazygosporum]
MSRFTKSAYYGCRFLKRETLPKPLPNLFLKSILPNNSASSTPSLITGAFQIRKYTTTLESSEEYFENLYVDLDHFSSKKTRKLFNNISSSLHSQMTNKKSKSPYSKKRLTFFLKKTHNSNILKFKDLDFFKLIHMLSTVILHNNPSYIYPLVHFYAGWLYSKSKIYSSSQNEKNLIKQVPVLLTSIVEPLCLKSMPYRAYSILSIFETIDVTVPGNIYEMILSQFLKQNKLKQAILLYLKTRNMNVVLNESLFDSMFYSIQDHKASKHYLSLLLFDRCPPKKPIYSSISTNYSRLNPRNPLLQENLKIRNWALLKMLNLDINTSSIQAILSQMKKVDDFQFLIYSIKSVKPDMLIKDTIYNSIFLTLTDLLEAYKYSPAILAKIYNTGASVAHSQLSEYNSKLALLKLKSDASFLEGFFAKELFSLLSSWNKVHITIFTKYDHGPQTSLNFVYFLCDFVQMFQGVIPKQAFMSALGQPIQLALEILLHNLKYDLNISNLQRLRASFPKRYGHSNPSIKTNQGNRFTQRVSLLNKLAERIFELIQPNVSYASPKELSAFLLFFTEASNFKYLQTTLNELEFTISKQQLNVEIDSLLNLLKYTIPKYASYNFNECLTALVDTPELLTIFATNAEIFSIFTTKEQWLNYKNDLFKLINSNTPCLNTLLANPQVVENSLFSMASNFNCKKPAFKDISHNLQPKNIKIKEVQENNTNTPSHPATTDSEETTHPLRSWAKEQIDTHSGLTQINWC